MSRPFRIEEANHWYYVRNYGRKGVAVFKDLKDSEMFLSLLVETCQRYGITCHCHTLLTGEFHLLLRISRANLAHFMRQLSGVYTQRYNRKYQLNGSLFRSRYQSALLDAQAYPLHLSLYIHQLFLLNSSIYQQRLHSSCDDYVKNHYVKNHLDTKQVNTTEINQQLQQLFPALSYQQFLQTALTNTVKEQVNKKHLPAIIGSYKFKAKYQRLLEASSKECCALSRMKVMQNKNEIVACTASIFHLPKSRILQAQYGHKNNSDARNMAMYLCQQHTNMTLKEIATIFGISHYASVSNRISYFKKTLKEQSSLQLSIDKVNQKLQDKIITE